MKIALLGRTAIGLKADYPHDHVGRDTIDNIDAVKDALLHLGHEVDVVNMDKDAFEKLRRNGYDIAFNLGDDGFSFDASLEPHIPAMLDILNVVYTGCDFFSLALCQDKAFTKKLLSFHKILTPSFQVFRSAQEKLNKKLNFPLIVKPLCEDASIGIKEESVVRNEEALRKRLSFMLEEYKQPVLAEEFIAGREINIGILGDEKIEILPISEIDFSAFPKDKEKICSYEAKWIAESESCRRSPPRCPAKLNPALEKTLKEISTLAYKITRCRDYARCDFRLDEEEKPYLLEVNPNPDLSRDAGLARMAKAAGWGYEELIGKIVNFAQLRKEKKEKEEALCPVESV